MLFAIRMVWREPSNHSSDWYFRLTPPVASGTSRKKEQRIDYPNIPSSIRPVPHGEDLPVPEPPKYLHFEFGGGRGRHGAAKGKGRTASIQNETMEIFG